jgi:hypothetical protein
MNFSCLEDFDAAFVATQEAETDALFERGRVMALAIDSGIPKREVIRRAKYLSRRSDRTVRYYLWDVFKDTRNPELDWGIHQLCAATENPQQWLEIASNGYINEKQEHCGHTYRTLKAAMKVSNDDPDAGSFKSYVDGCIRTSIELMLDGAIPPTPDNTEARITLVLQAPAILERPAHVDPDGQIIPVRQLTPDACLARARLLVDSMMSSAVELNFIFSTLTLGMSEDTREQIQREYFAVSESLMGMQKVVELLERKAAA